MKTALTASIIGSALGRVEFQASDDPAGPWGRKIVRRRVQRNATPKVGKPTKAEKKAAKKARQRARSQE